MRQIASTVGSLSERELHDLTSGPMDSVDPRYILPPEKAQAIVSEVEQSLEGHPSNSVAAGLAVSLAGLYAQAIPDRDTYLEGLKRTLLKYPPDLCERAVDEVSEESDFPPPRAMLRRKLDELVDERKRMIRRAKAHIAEHDRREREANETRLTPEQMRKALGADPEEIFAFANKQRRR